ncbi:MAG: hypothetical protein ACRDHW_13890 [Ktedonobacteraceae bacterium]
MDCGARLRRASTITERTVITLKEVLQVVHRGYCCPVVECPGHQRQYRRCEADALALPGFTFGLDLVLLVGQLRLREHQTVDEIHRTLIERLAVVGQTISQREVLFLFEAYTALLRAGTEVSQAGKRGDCVTQMCQKRLIRLQTIVYLHEEKTERCSQVRGMREWVLAAERIWDGSWAICPEEVTNEEVARRFDAYLASLSREVSAEERTADERLRLGHLLKVLTHLRPGLVQCYAPFWISAHQQ